MPKLLTNALSATFVLRHTTPGRYADGNGLYLLIDPKGFKRWLLRTSVAGRRVDMGLGSLRLKSLSQARQDAKAHRAVARSGGDPLADKRKARAVPTFTEAAQQVFASKADGWKNAKHRKQWISTLIEYAYPSLGGMRINAIDTQAVENALRPIWLTKPETARRVRQRMGVVFKWAKARGYCDDNPADAAVTQHVLPKQKKPSEAVEHHAALPYAAVAGFVADVQRGDMDDSTKRALEFLILTACRTGEAIGALWREIDDDAATWTIPAERMKAGVEHRIPLSPRAMELLRLQCDPDRRDADAPVFPARDGESPLSNMAFLMAVRRMRPDSKITVHGFRSSFRDWASERTNFPAKVCEAALAHKEPNKAAAAYARSDLFEKRRMLMDQWAAFVATPARQATVLPMTRTAPVVVALPRQGKVSATSKAPRHAERIPRRRRTRRVQQR